MQVELKTIRRKHTLVLTAATLKENELLARLVNAKGVMSLRCVRSEKKIKARIARIRRRARYRA